MSKLAIIISAHALGVIGAGAIWTALDVIGPQSVGGFAVISLAGVGAIASAWVVVCRVITDAEAESERRR